MAEMEWTEGRVVAGKFREVKKITVTSKRIEYLRIGLTREVKRAL